MTRDSSSDHEQLRAALVDLRPRLHRFALGLSGTPHDADDLVQAGYERAFARLGQWQRGTRLDSWMYRIIQSIYFNRLRNDRVRHAHLARQTDDEHTSPDAGATAIAQITLDRVHTCVARLPEEQRACLLLVVVEGLSYKEAAGVLDVPIGTITSRIARARASLRSMLNTQLKASNDE